ncbi:histone-lysine N-methyltransferase SMYD3-like isoform X2 [Ornithodoros turicata]|uniref:histone-lysine N-methyltransferase SMYD3-like isoform X2 n=1 Tax=Ornithodoros turicata TaxID=34597 RepID=UPI003138A346
MRTYKRGDIILTSKPFACVVDPQSSAGKVCDFCFKRTDCLKPCARCRVAYYCNKLCETSALSDHLQECRYLQKAYPHIPTTTVRLMARVLLKLKRMHKKDCKELLPGGRTRSFQDLLSHSNDIMNDAAVLPRFRAIWATLQDFLGDENLPPIDEGLEIYGKLIINTFCISDNDLKPVGQGLYLAASIFDHSCEPNAAFTFEGTQITVRATRNMRVEDMREIYICYVDKAQLAQDRIASLQEQYYFTCCCRLCWQATHNNVEILEEKSHGLSESIRSLQRQLEHADSPDDTSRILEKSGDILRQVGELPANDVSKVEALELAFEAATKFGLYNRAVVYALQGIEIIRACYGEFSTKYAIRLANLGKMFYYLHDQRNADAFLQEASHVVAITHGKNHSVYRDVLRYRQLCRRSKAQRTR